VGGWGGGGGGGPRSSRLDFDARGSSRSSASRSRRARSSTRLHHVSPVAARNTRWKEGSACPPPSSFPSASCPWETPSRDYVACCNKSEKLRSRGCFFALFACSRPEHVKPCARGLGPAAGAVASSVSARVRLIRKHRMTSSGRIATRHTEQKATIAIAERRFTSSPWRWRRKRCSRGGADIGRSLPPHYAPSAGRSWRRLYLSDDPRSIDELSEEAGALARATSFATLRGLEAAGICIGIARPPRHDRSRFAGSSGRNHRARTSRRCGALVADKHQARRADLDISETRVAPRRTQSAAHAHPRAEYDRFEILFTRLSPPSTARSGGGWGGISSPHRRLPTRSSRVIASVARARLASRHENAARSVTGRRSRAPRRGHMSI